MTIERKTFTTRLTVDLEIERKTFTIRPTEHPEYHIENPEPQSQSSPARPGTGSKKLPQFNTRSIVKAAKRTAILATSTDTKRATTKTSAALLNHYRVNYSNEQDEILMSKYLLPMSSMFSIQLAAPRPQPTPGWLISNIACIIAKPIRTSSKPPISLDTSPECIRHNTALLAAADFDLVATFLSSHQD